MPLIMDGARIPAIWAGKKRSRRVGAANGFDSTHRCLEIALINNMPDAALEDTELQFFELLESAAGDIPVRIKLYSLPNIPRSDRGQQHLSKFYFGLEDLWNANFDGIIMTGTEPRQPNLRDEPYWPALADVLNWAEQNTTSTVLSCLAAHAGVLHGEGIPRHPLSDKQFGVFSHKKTCDHALLDGTPDVLRNPHSRWNEVREDELIASGYLVLTKSEDVGVDLFAKKKGKSLFVHFQGHPEYGAYTLLKEYRRDIKRFIRRERETYPSMPQGYFDATAKLVNDFQKKVVADPQEELMAAFPEVAIMGALKNTWQPSATCVYRNWLQYLVVNKRDTIIHSANRDRGMIHVGQ